jgi:hypothetical protein
LFALSAAPSSARSIASAPTRARIHFERGLASLRAELTEDPQAVRHIWEAGRPGVGETDADKMDFPAMSLREAIEAFTYADYGERLNFGHA